MQYICDNRSNVATIDIHKSRTVFSQWYYNGCDFTESMNNRKKGCVSFFSTMIATTIPYVLTKNACSVFMQIQS